MSILPQSKWGNCSVCGEKDTAVVKVAKDLVCLNCRRGQKNKIQVSKANQRNAVRALPHLRDNDKELMESRNNLIVDLDAIVSKFVRIRDADIHGKVKCYTCNTVKHWTLMQCGHYAKRANMGLRWDAKRNLRTQCKHCNEDLGGNYEVYSQELNKEQEGLAEELTLEARETVKVGIDEMRGMIIDYRAKLKIIEQKLKNDIHTSK